MKINNLGPQIYIRPIQEENKGEKIFHILNYTFTFQSDHNLSQAN